MNKNKLLLIGLLVAVILAGLFTVTKTKAQGNPHQQPTEKQVVILDISAFAGVQNVYGLYVGFVSRSSNAPVIPTAVENPPGKWAPAAQAIADLLNQGFRIDRVRDYNYTLVKELLTSDTKSQEEPRRQPIEKQVVIFSTIFFGGSHPNGPGVYGRYVYNASSSSNAPVIATYWYNPAEKWVPEAQALADLLSNGFRIVHTDNTYTPTYTLVKE